jgi:hypothetical protein
MAPAPGLAATPVPLHQEVEMPNDIRAGGQGRSAAARPTTPTRRPTTVDLVLESVLAVSGGVRFVTRHPLLVLALLVTAALVDSNYLP